MTRDRTSRRSKANKFPRKRSIRFKSPETGALINLLSFFANLPENSTNTNGEFARLTAQISPYLFRMMRDPYGHDTRFKCPGLVTAAAQQKGHLHGGGIVI